MALEDDSVATGRGTCINLFIIIISFGSGARQLFHCGWWGADVRNITIVAIACLQPQLIPGDEPTYLGAVLPEELSR